MEDPKKRAAVEYKRSEIMTAGTLKSHQMLLDKALYLMKHYEEGDEESQVLIQNLLSQVQSSLNITYQPAKEIFVSIAPIWDAVETGNKELIDKAMKSVEYLRDTIVLIQKK